MKTTEYIKRKAVLNAVGELFTICSHTLPNEFGHHYVVEKDIETFYDYVKDIPTADVRPVVRGEWIEAGDNQPVSSDTLYCCSRCGHGKRFASTRTNFCPNCGADMRRSKDD